MGQHWEGGEQGHPGCGGRLLSNTVLNMVFVLDSTKVLALPLPLRFIRQLLWQAEL